jgi:hypothetical protein
MLLRLTCLQRFAKLEILAYLSASELGHRPTGDNKMGAVDIAATVKVDKVYERVLKELDLAEDQLNSQGLEKLEETLETVNDLIKTPDSLPSIDLGILGTKSQINALPLLLQRKKVILDRIRSLRSSKQIDSIRDLIDHVHDKDIKTKLNQELGKLEDQSKSIKQQTEDTDRELGKQLRFAESEKLRLELFEKRSKIFQSFLERESVATIIGGLLMIFNYICYYYRYVCGRGCYRGVRQCFFGHTWLFFRTISYKGDARKKRREHLIQEGRVQVSGARSTSTAW